jgi:hypothetical protein
LDSQPALHKNIYCDDLLFPYKMQLSQPLSEDETVRSCAFAKYRAQPLSENGEVRQCAFVEYRALLEDYPGILMLRGTPMKHFSFGHIHEQNGQF